MVEIQFFYKTDTLQIEAVYGDSTTNSSVFKDTNVYTEINVVDPPYSVTRNHKVILNAEGEVIDTEESANPVQPPPWVNPNQNLIDELRNLWLTLTPTQKRLLLRRALLKLLAG